ncbi:MAG: mannitol-1-phosphate 5-dehydrogenase [Chloroflexi bacterium]|nr:mannitol-1-phosphate 5-dehydrogenase [Chloroflexota bacterium]
MKEAVIFGAGNIGRGFIGQLYSESGYQVTFVDVDQPLLDAINARGEYTIRLVTNDKSEEVRVGPVRALHAGNADEVAALVSRAEIGATAVGANVLKFVAPNLAKGIARRAAEGNTSPLHLVICENLKGAAAIVRGMVKELLPAEAQEFMQANIGFVDTVIARMVPPPTPEMRAQDPSLIVVEPYKRLPVDRKGFIGEPPAIVGMTPYAPFSFFTERKLYIHNAGHAVLAYLGYRRGHEYGYEALADEDIYFQVRGAMEESALTLARKYRPPQGQLLANIDDLLHRFENRALGDTILRLGRDPIRKLGRTDRLVGAALNALAEGVAPVNIVAGIAAALKFNHPDDPLAAELQARLHGYGLARTLSEVCELPPAEPLFEMVKAAYREIGD